MVQKYVWRNYMVAAVASMGMAMFGYDGTMFSSIQIFKSWKKSFDKPDPADVGAVQTAYSVAAIVFGYLVSPYVSDRFGRKWSIGSGAMLIFISAFVMTWAPNIGGFIGARVLSGAGQGMAMPAGPVYIEEIVFPKTRGRIMSLWQEFYSIGNLLSNYIALGCQYSPQLGSWQWRIVTLFQILIPVSMLPLLFFCPETPRWYVQKGQVEKARAVLATVRAEEDVDPEIEEIQKAVLYEQERTRGSYKQLLLTHSYRKRLVIACVMNIGQQFSGIGSLTTYSGIILNQVFASVDTVLIVKAVEAVVVLFCPMIAFFFIDRWGRRPLFIWGAIGQAFCMFIIATVVTQLPLNAKGHHPLSAGIVTVIFTMLFHVFYGPAYGAGLWTWTSEIWPHVVRANGTAISSQCQQLANIVLGQAFPSFLAAANYYTFYFFMGCNIALAIFAYFMIAETKGVPLEHIDTIFGGVDHVTAGEMAEEGKIVDEGDKQMEHVTMLETSESKQ